LRVVALEENRVLAYNGANTKRRDVIGMVLLQKKGILVVYEIQRYMYNATSKGVLYMRTRRNKVNLEAEQRAKLMRMTKNGKHSAMELNHANILLDLDENQDRKYTQKQIASKYRMCPETVAKIARRFVEGGMENALERKKRETPAVPSKFTGEVEARIVKLACSAPPKGRKRWTLKLLADETMRLEILDSISDNGIRMLLKKRNLSLI